jgi:hypothetical protein
MKSPIEHWSFALRLIAVVGALSLINYLLLPWEASINLMRENGLIEYITILVYYLALATLWLFAPPKLTRGTIITISVLLLACAARELDLHKALFGMSILKLNFYRHYATGNQIAVALLIMLPVFTSIGFLLIRHGRWLLDGVRCRQPAAITVMSTLALLVALKILDRSLGLAAKFGDYLAPLALKALVLSIEEPFELLLPLLSMVAVIQAQRGARSTSAY